MSLLDKICQAFIKMIRKKPEYKKVWQNASPTSTFNPQVLSLDGLAVTGVDGVRILTKRNSSDTDAALYITCLLYTSIFEAKMAEYRLKLQQMQFRRSSTLRVT